MREEYGKWKRGSKTDENGKRKPPPKARKVTTSLIRDVAAALISLVKVKDEIEQPAWLMPNPSFPADETLPCRNSLVHLPSVPLIFD